MPAGFWPWVIHSQPSNCDSASSFHMQGRVCLWAANNLPNWLCGPGAADCHGLPGCHLHSLQGANILRSQHQPDELVPEQRSGSGCRYLAPCFYRVSLACTMLKSETWLGMGHAVDRMPDLVRAMALQAAQVFRACTLGMENKCCPASAGSSG